MNCNVLLLLFLTLISCTIQTQQKADTGKENSTGIAETYEATLDSNYVPTQLPIRLELLGEKVKKHIQDLNAADTSSYLIETRPIVFQIQGVTNSQDQTRYTRSFYRDVETMIYAVGEAKDSKLIDYGWIENQQGDTIWKMRFEDSEHAGGDPRNRKVFTTFTLRAGHYNLRYISNTTHANEDWHGAPPEYPFYYGITVFNMKAIEKILNDE